MDDNTLFAANINPILQQPFNDNNRSVSEWLSNRTSLHELYNKLLNDQSYYSGNRSWEFTFYNDSNENVINLLTNETATSVTVPTNILELTTALNGTVEYKPWWRNWDGMPYPSGYTQLAIVLLAFFITCIMILIVVGNMLVCIAIATEKSLKPVQNWFIASLAVSDFLLGLVIMPFSLARELMGYWMFGKVWCDIWLALDVLLCTASINNLFMISLDRYWSITQAVKYLKKRTPSRAALMIAFVWMLSAVVSLPPLVGWKKPDMMVSQEFPQCNVSEDVGYVMYSSIGSFYFPALMMVFVYARIFHAARARARRHVQQKRLQIQQEVTADPIKEKSTTTTTCTSLSNPSPPDLTDQNNEGGDDGVAGYKPYTPESSPLPISFTTGSQPHTGGPQIQRTTPPMGTPTTVSPPQIVVEAIPDSQSSTPQKDISIIYNNYESITPTPVDAIVDNNDCDVRFKCLKQTKCSPGVQTKRKPPKLTIVLPESTVPPKGLTKQNGSAIRTTETRFISTDDDSDAAESPLSRDTITHESKTFLSAPKLLKSQTYGSTLSIADYDESDMCMDNDIENSDDNVKSKKSSIKGGGRSVQCRNQTTGGLRSTTSDAERHKRKIAKARERRATLILGLIMAAFITAWLPFFVLYMLAALCQDCKDAIPSAYFSVAFWLGYCNSAANPIIYTIFNRDFRRAFRKILFK